MGESPILQIRKPRELSKLPKVTTVVTVVELGTCSWASHLRGLGWMEQWMEWGAEGEADLI